MDLPSPAFQRAKAEVEAIQDAGIIYSNEIPSWFSDFNVNGRHQEKCRRDQWMTPRSFLPKRFYSFFPIILSSLGALSDGRVYRFLSSLPNLPQNFPLQKHLGKHRNSIQCYCVYFMSLLCKILELCSLPLIPDLSENYFHWGNYLPKKFFLISWKLFTRVVFAFGLVLGATSWLRIWILIISTRFQALPGAAVWKREIL